MSAASASGRLRDNLRQHLDSLQVLLDLLQQEREALPNDDIEALERITRSKASATEHLHALGRELPSLRASVAGEPEEWAAVQALAARCQSANSANASLLDVRARAVRGKLQVLRGNPVASVYGRSGNAAAFGSRRLGLA